MSFNKFLSVWLTAYKYVYVYSCTNEAPVKRYTKITLKLTYLH